MAFFAALAVVLAQLRSRDLQLEQPEAPHKAVLEATEELPNTLTVALVPHGCPQGCLTFYYS